MRKLFSAFIIFGLIGFNFDVPEIPTVDVNEIIDQVNENIPESSFGTYTDSAYTDKRTNFSSGQTIYFLSEAQIDENASRSLILQDVNQNKVSDISVTISERGYIAQFSAPTKEGVYYLHFEVIGEGLSIVNETNISVGGNGGVVEGESTVVSNVTTEVISGSEDGEIVENYEKMPKNRIYLYDFLGTWLGKIIELIINNLNEA